MNAVDEVMKGGSDDDNILSTKKTQPKEDKLQK